MHSAQNIQFSMLYRIYSRISRPPFPRPKMWQKLAYKLVTKIGAKRVPWICGLIMCERRVHKNSKRARDSVAPDSLCVARLNDGLARSGVKLQWMTYLVCSRNSSISQCVAPPPAARASTATRRPSGLLMVHATLTLAANVWLCGMTRV